MWWWIEPLFEIGLICATIALIILIVSHETGTDIPVYIALVFMLPLGISICSLIIWTLIYIFKEIWCPYL